MRCLLSMIDFMNFQNSSSDLKPMTGPVVLHELGVRVGLDPSAVLSLNPREFSSTGFCGFCPASSLAHHLVELAVSVAGYPCVVWL